jgi:hypothetical protein
VWDQSCLLRSEQRRLERAPGGRQRWQGPCSLREGGREGEEEGRGGVWWVPVLPSSTGLTVLHLPPTSLPIPLPPSLPPSHLPGCSPPRWPYFPPMPPPLPPPPAGKPRADCARPVPMINLEAVGEKP